MYRIVYKLFAYFNLLSDLKQYLISLYLNGFSRSFVFQYATASKVHEELH